MRPLVGVAGNKFKAEQKDALRQTDTAGYSTEGADAV